MMSINGHQGEIMEALLCPSYAIVGRDRRPWDENARDRSLPWSRTRPRSGMADQRVGIYRPGVSA